MFTSLVIFGVIMFAITFISVKATDALRPVESAPYQKNSRNITDFQACGIKLVNPWEQAPTS